MTKDEIKIMLSAEIRDSLELGEAAHEKSWGHEKGILISREEAESILACILDLDKK